MEYFPRENRRSFTKRAANFSERLFGRFRPKSLTNALKYGKTENAKRNTTRGVPKLGFGPGGLIHSLNGKYISPETDVEPDTRKAEIREQNRFRRVMALLDEKNFESFFGFSDMNVEQDPRDRHPPRVIIEDYERLLTTRKRYGNNSGESKDEINEGYNDLLFMILQLLFSVCFYLLNDLKIELHKKLNTRLNPGINPTEREKLEELYKKIKKTIDKAEEITKFYSRVQDAKNADFNKITKAFIISAIGTFISTLLILTSGSIAPVVVLTFGFSSVALVKLFSQTKKAENRRDLQFYMYIKGLHKLFQIIFNPKNVFSFENLVEKNYIDWGVFNKAQIEFIIERAIPVKEIDKEPNCPQCLECMNKENYYDMDPPKTKEEIKNINSLTDDEYFEIYKECESMPAEQLLCAHRFHTRCINKWIGTEKLRGKDAPCPICRAPILKYADYNYANKSFDLDPASPIGDKNITSFLVDDNSLVARRAAFLDENISEENLRRRFYNEQRMTSYKVPTTIPVRKTAALKEWTKERSKEGAEENMNGIDEEIMENSSKKFTGGMTEVMFLNFLTRLLNLYYEPGKDRVLDAAAIEELGKTPVFIKRGTRREPNYSLPNKADYSTRYAGFGSEELSTATKPELSLRAPAGGKRRTRKYKRLTKK